MNRLKGFILAWSSAASRASPRIADRVKFRVHQNLPMDQVLQSQRNRLLELLDRESFERLRPHLQQVTFDYRIPLNEQDRLIEFVATQ